MKQSKLWRVKAGKSFDLSKIDSSGTPGSPGGRTECDAALQELREEFATLQEKLWGEDRRSLLIVLQAMDTGGKDGVIRHVLKGVNPQGVRVVSFKAPTPEELDHDFVWRIHRAAPARGEIGVFNRSHYEDVGIVRVHSLVPEDIWRQRYDLINNFERQLVHGETVILKFFLHISAEEQKERLQARLDDPDKRWKFNKGDLEERKHWNDYQLAYTEALERTATPDAPWFVIPADHKWYRNWAVASVIAETLRKMDPKFPDPADLEGVVIT